MVLLVAVRVTIFSASELALTARPDLIRGCVELCAPALKQVLAKEESGDRNTLFSGEVTVRGRPALSPSFHGRTFHFIRLWESPSGTSVPVNIDTPASSPALTPRLQGLTFEATVFILLWALTPPVVPSVIILSLLARSTLTLSVGCELL